MEISMKKKRIKNPLIRRIPRELTGDWKKYLVVSLFLILMIGFVSGMYVANESMMKHCLMQLGQAIKQMSDSITLMRQKRSWIKSSIVNLKKSSKKNLMRSLKQNLRKNLMQSSSQNLMFLLMHR